MKTSSPFSLYSHQPGGSGHQPLQPQQPPVIAVATALPTNPTASSSSSYSGNNPNNSSIAQGIPACPDVASKRLLKEWSHLVSHGGFAVIPHCVHIALKASENIFEWAVYIAEEAISTTAFRVDSMELSSSGGGGGGGGQEESFSCNLTTNSPPHPLDPSTRESICPTKEELQKCLLLDVLFPRNYPFSPPLISCQDYALFVPTFIPEWSPRMKMQSVLTTMIRHLPHVWFPINHIKLPSSGCLSDEITVDSTGLRITNESTVARTVMLCVKPIPLHDHYYWSVYINRCSSNLSTLVNSGGGGSSSGGGSTHNGSPNSFRSHSSSSCCSDTYSSESSVVIGVTTLWPKLTLLQYTWGYLEEGVIQLILLPKGTECSPTESSAGSYKVEKLNRYDYAAEEIHTVVVEPFTTGDLIGVFYNGGKPSSGSTLPVESTTLNSTPTLSFYKNGILQCTIYNCLSFAGATMTSPVTPGYGKYPVPCFPSTLPIPTSTTSSADFVVESKPSGRGRPRHSLDGHPLVVGSHPSGCSERSSNSPASMTTSPSILSPADRTSVEGRLSVHSTSDQSLPPHLPKPSRRQCQNQSPNWTNAEWNLEPKMKVATDSPFTMGDSAVTFPAVEESALVLYPAISLGKKGDILTFEFEPPLWHPQTHQFYPKYFTSVVITLLYALEKRPHQLTRELAITVISWIGVGYDRIGIS